jgi:hypothetical protein
MAKEHDLNNWCKIFMKAATRQDVLIISSHGGQVAGAEGWEPTGAWKPIFYTEKNYGACTYGDIPSWYTRYEQDELSAFNTASSSRAGRTPGDFSLTKFQKAHDGRKDGDGRSDESYSGILAEVAKTGNDFDVLTIRNKDSKKLAVKLSEVYAFLDKGTIGGHDLKYPKIICAFCLVGANYGNYVNALTGEAYTV